MCVCEWCGEEKGELGGGRRKWGGERKRDRRVSGEGWSREVVYERQYKKRETVEVTQSKRGKHMI